MRADVIIGGVGLLQFDCILSESHTETSVLTDHAVEEGCDLTDNIRSQPSAIDLVGVVSNYPIYAEGSVMASPVKTDMAPATNRVEAAYACLLKAKENGERLTVVTSLKDYTNMAITNVNVTCDAATGDALKVSLSLRKIWTAYTLTVEVSAAKDSLKKSPANKGTKTPVEEAPPSPAPPQSDGDMTSIPGPGG